MRTFKQFLEESEQSSQVLIDWVSYHVGAITDPLDAEYKESFELGEQVTFENGKLSLSDSTLKEMDDQVHWLGILGWGDRFNLPIPFSVGGITTSIGGWNGFEPHALSRLTDIEYIYFTTCHNIPIDEIVDMAKHCHITLYPDNASFIGSFMKLINNPSIDAWEPPDESRTDVEKAFDIINKMKRESNQTSHHIDEFEFQSTMIDAGLEHLL